MGKLSEDERQLLISEYRSSLQNGPLCQRDMMRLLFLENGENERTVVNAYVAAEGAGDVERKRDRNGTKAEQYAQSTLFRRGIREGWIYPDYERDLHGLRHARRRRRR